MRESVWYFGLAVLFAIYLTWRITGSIRKTLRDRESVRNGPDVQ